LLVARIPYIVTVWLVTPVLDPNDTGVLRASWQPPPVSGPNFTNTFDATSVCTAQSIRSALFACTVQAADVMVSA